MLVCDVNGTDQQFDLLSNDDSKRPEVHGNTYMRDSPVPAPPYSDFRADNFVIPWRDHGRCSCVARTARPSRSRSAPTMSTRTTTNVIVYHDGATVMMYHADIIGPERHHHVTLRLDPGHGFGFGFQDRRAPNLFESQNEILLLALLLGPPADGDEDEECDEDEEGEDEE